MAVIGFEDTVGRDRSGWAPVFGSIGREIRDTHFLDMFS